MSDPTPAQSDETPEDANIEGFLVVPGDNTKASVGAGAFTFEQRIALILDDLLRAVETDGPKNTIVSNAVDRIAAEKARIYDALEGLLRPVPHSSGDPLGLLADTRNALRAELRAEIRRLREGEA